MRLAMGGAILAELALSDWISYPTVDPGPETELVARLHEAVTGDGEVDPAVIDAVVATLDEEVERTIEDLRRLRRF